MKKKYTPPEYYIICFDTLMTPVSIDMSGETNEFDAKACSSLFHWDSEKETQEYE